MNDYKYHVVYKEYEDYNQSEGYWELRIEHFTTLKKAVIWIGSAKGNPNISDIIGPLKRVKPVSDQKKKI